MSIDDPLVVQEWHELFIVTRGSETFFDEERKMLTFETVEEAERFIDERACA